MIVTEWLHVPDSNCKGMCADACGPIGMSQKEADRIAANHDGLELSVDETLTCSALHDGRCTIYDDRPLVCRLWGSTDRLPCPFGCEPDNGLLPTVRANELMTSVMADSPPILTHQGTNQ